jgi:hypothetical protein
MELEPIELAELNVGSFAQTFSSKAPNQWTQTTGVITAIDAGGHTVTVKVVNQTTTTSGVPYINHYHPKVGAAVIIKTNGSDMYVDGALVGNGGIACCGRNGHGTASGSIATGTLTEVTWDGTADFDPYSMWNGTTGWTIPFDGYWWVQATVGWSANATGIRATHIYVDGAVQAISAVGSGANASPYVECNFLGSLSKNSVVTVWAAHYTGGSALTILGSAAQKFSIFYLGSNV